MRRQRFTYTFWVATVPDKSDAVRVLDAGYEAVPGEDIYLFMRTGHPNRVQSVRYFINDEEVNVATAAPWDLLSGGQPWAPESGAHDVLAEIQEQ